jgi:hypothetical protein
MTDKMKPDELEERVEIDESEDEAEGEDARDDRDYMPKFIVRLLDNPPLLPGECPGEFEQLYEHFEYSHLGRAKTVIEHIIVYNGTMLAWELMRYQRMKVSATLNQQRVAVESLFRKTHEGALMEGAASGLRAAASRSADGWFRDPADRARAAKRFEAAGYASDAVEAEAFQRSLPTLATIDNLIASAQKRLMSFLKDLESRYGARGKEARLNAAQGARVSRQKKTKK